MSKSSLIVCLSAIAMTLTVFAPHLAEAQPNIYFRVEISVPVASGAPEVRALPFTGTWSLAEREAIQNMSEHIQWDMSSAVRECQMPIAVEIDVHSFHGHLVAGTADGLFPGARGRFNSLVRALTAICHRGDMERGAVQQRIRAVRFGWTDSTTDAMNLQGDTVVYETNGDLVGPTHMDYSPFINWFASSL